MLNVHGLMLHVLQTRTFVGFALCGLAYYGLAPLFSHLADWRLCGPRTLCSLNFADSQSVSCGVMPKKELQ